jgi:hypothetical protein
MRWTICIYHPCIVSFSLHLLLLCCAVLSRVRTRGRASCFLSLSLSLCAVLCWCSLPLSRSSGWMAKCLIGSGTQARRFVTGGSLALSRALSLALSRSFALSLFLSLSLSLPPSPSPLPLTKIWLSAGWAATCLIQPFVYALLLAYSSLYMLYYWPTALCICLLLAYVYTFSCPPVREKF